MTQEDKELLFKDLCARLPYGVIVEYKRREKEGDIKMTCGNIIYVAELGNGWWKECKPYLRSESSMTNEEYEEYYNISHGIINIGSKYTYYDLCDWLNAHHFDYRGLIEKGLALEAPEGMY